MKKWLRRIRAAIVVGLTWAVGWTVAGMLGMIVVYLLFPGLPEVVDIWIPVFAYPGFLAGVGFSVVLRIAEGRRRFDELSLPRFAAWGAVGGALVGALAALLGSASVPGGALLAIMGTSTVLGAASASASLALARTEDDRQLLSDSVDVAEVGLTQTESKELLGG